MLELRYCASCQEPSLGAATPAYFLCFSVCSNKRGIGFHSIIFLALFFWYYFSGLPNQAFPTKGLRHHQFSKPLCTKKNIGLVGTDAPLVECFCGCPTACINWDRQTPQQYDTNSGEPSLGASPHIAARFINPPTCGVRHNDGSCFEVLIYGLPGTELA